MDKRYSQSRFYNGIKGSNDRSKQADKLVERYKSRFYEQARNAQDYGGSTGGRKSLASYQTGLPPSKQTSNTGLNVLRERAKAIREKNRFFKEEGSGVFGGRAEMGRMRTSYSQEYGFRDPKTGDLFEEDPNEIIKTTRTSPPQEEEDSPELGT